MYKSPVKAALAGVFFLAVVICLCVAAICLKGEWRQEPSPAAALSNEEKYRNQGLEPGVMLATVPEEVTETQVTFSDRVLLRCAWSLEEEEKGIQALRDLLTAVKARYSQVNTFVMTVPLRIGFEQDFSTDDSYLQLVREEREALEALEGRVISGVEGLAEGIAVIGTLDEHRSEYIFYRSDWYWSALGAYYGAQEFLEAAGLETFPLDSFYETAKNALTGTLVDPNGTIHDWGYVYLYRNYNPMQDRLETGEQAPLVSLARGGIGLFVGGDSCANQFDGLAENGRSLLLLGSGNGAVLAPWMVTQFESVVFLDLDRYSADDLDFWQLFSDYSITDMLVLEDTKSIVSPRAEDAFQDVALQP